MKYHIDYTSAAQRSMKKIKNKALLTKIYGGIGRLAGNPRPHKVKKIQGAKDMYRIKISDYRVIYTIKDSELLVLVVKVAARKDVYKNVLD